MKTYDMELINTNTASIKKKITWVDLLAAALCAGLFVYLFVENGRGFGFVDEGFYYSLTQRLAMGDKFLIHEWHPGQFAALFEYLPYRLYTALSGGTDGVILFMRYVYLSVDLVLFWLYYRRLRRYKLAGLAAVFLFCAYLFAGICALNYYTICLHAMMTVALILFPEGKEPSGAALVFTGVAVSCAVLSQPAFAVLYFAYTLIVLLRAAALKRRPQAARRREFALGIRVWSRMTLGAVVCAAAFLIFLFAANGGVSETIKAIPELFTDSEYAIHIYGNYANPNKVRMMAKMYGAAPLVLTMLSPALAAVCKRFFPKREAKAAVLIFTCGVILYSLIRACVELFSSPDHIVYFLFGLNFCVLFLTPVCYILCEKKNRRVFAFWCLAAAVCAVMDYVSEITVDYGASLAYFPAIYCFASLLRELRAPDGTAAPVGAVRRVLTAAVGAAGCLLVLWSLFAVGMTFSYKPVEKAYNRSDDRSVSVRLTDGPYKGIATTRRNSEIYGLIISDMDLIREKCGGAFYVAQNLPYYYLAAERPIGTYSTWYVEEDSVDRLRRYWELHPEKRPEYIYIPFYEYYTFRTFENIYQNGWTASQLDRIKSFCSFTPEPAGAAGYILRVDGWKI